MATKQRRRPQHLFNLRPEEISLVDEGANGKRILITKRRRETMAKTPQARTPLTPQQKVQKRMAQQPKSVLQKIEKGIASYAKKRANIRKDLMGDEDEEAAAPGEPLSDAAQAALKAAARIVQPYADEISQGDLDYVGEMVGVQGDPDEMAPDVAAPIDGDIAMADEGDATDDGEEDRDAHKGDTDDVEMAVDDDPPPPPSPADAPPDDEDSGDEDDDPGEMDDDDAANDDSVNIALPSDAPEGVDDEDHAAAAQAARAAYVSTLESTGYTVTKSRVIKKRAARETMPSELKATLARIEKRAVQSEKIIKSLTQRLESETAARRDAEYRARAKSEFGNLGDEAKIAKSLRVVRETQGEDAAKEFEETLKVANARIQKSREYGGDLFSELGSSLPGTTPDSGEGRINAMADEIIQKAVQTGDDKRSPEQIRRAVLKSKEGRREYARARMGR